MDTEMKSLDELIRRDKKFGKPLRRGGALPGRGRGGLQARNVPKIGQGNQINKQTQKKQ